MSQTRLRNAEGRVTPSKLLWLIVVLKTLTLTDSYSQSCYSQPTGLVSWWPAEGNASDIVGSNPGILQNGTGFGPGEVGEAFSFNGISNYIKIPLSPSINVGTGAGFTLECWIKPSDLSTEHALAEWNDAAGHIGVQLWISISALGGPGSIYANIVSTAGGSYNFATPPNLLNTTSFQHVALTYDKSTGMGKLFYNGSAVATPNLGIFTPQTSYDLYFGTRISGPAGVGAFYSGLMDEVSLYNRALQDSEVLAIFNAGTLGKCRMEKPAIVSQPKNWSAAVGGNAFFSVSAIGASLAYQWHFNTVDIPDGTNAVLALSNIQTNQAGNYCVTLTNAYGSTTSSTAVLTITRDCVSAAPGLVSWWPAEGDANDPFTGNNGTLHGSLGFATGESGQAFNFNGTNAYISVPSPSLLDVGASDGLTVECWLKPTDLTSGHPILEWNDHSGNVGVHLWHSDPQISGPGGVFANVTDTSGGSHIIASAANLITTNSFQHIAVTYSKATGEARLYRNAGAIAVQNLGTFRPQTTYDFYIGTRASGPGGGTLFSGLVDELAVYNRALSDSEVRSIYTAGSLGKTCIPPEILTQPQNQRVRPGTNIVVVADIRGTLPLSFQWRLNTTNISGATNSSLVINDVQPGDAGNYSLKITNALGSIISSNALLKVDVLFAFGNDQPLTNSQAIFGGPVSVQLQNVYTNGYVFYTLDGSIPTFTSSQYNGPFVVTNNVILRALGYSTDFFQSGQLDPVAILIVPTYSLRVSTAGGGIVTLDPPGGSYLGTTIVNLTATADSGWIFLQWLGDLTGTNPATSLTMTRNKSVSAVFGTILNTTAAGGGTVVVNPSNAVYPYGQVVRLTAIPDPGNYFGLWGNSATGNVNPLTFVITNANPTVSSLFGAVNSGQVALTIVPIGSGQIGASPRANVYSVNQMVTISGMPDSGQSFDGWGGDAGGTQNPLAVIMDKSKTIYANFTHNANLRVNGGGLKPEGFIFTLTGDFGAVYQIQSTTNLSNWVNLVTLTNTYGTLQVADPGASNLNSQFYRSFLMP